MKKLLWVTLTILIPLKIFGQIQIDQVGDNWKPQVVQALELIKKTDTNTYKFVVRHCKKISFWNGAFSTVEGNSTITISQGDMSLNSIENIACIIVHESKHLEIIQSGFEFPLPHEECICYIWEYQFIEKLVEEPEWIKENCINMIMKLDCYQMKLNQNEYL
jgi:hypothetical protein